MDVTFVDTSGFYAHLDRTDPDHEAATAFFRAHPHPLVTTNFVFDETLTLAKVRLGTRAAVRFGDTIRKGAGVRVIRVDVADEDRAWAVFRRDLDKGYSFTDCTSFAVMERLGIDRAMAFDRHFQQFGRFSVLP